MLCTNIVCVKAFPVCRAVFSYAALSCFFTLLSTPVCSHTLPEELMMYLQVAGLEVTWGIRRWWRPTVIWLSASEWDSWNYWYMRMAGSEWWTQCCNDRIADDVVKPMAIWMCIFGHRSNQTACVCFSLTSSSWRHAWNMLLWIYNFCWLMVDLHVSPTSLVQNTQLCLTLLSYCTSVFSLFTLLQHNNTA